MTAQVYENINELSYVDLLDAIDKMREKIYELGDGADDAPGYPLDDFLSLPLAALLQLEADSLVVPVGK